MTAAKKQCIYCGQEIRGVRKGEHVVPQALGMIVTIPRVCKKCNNNELSQLDNELVTASPLHIAARKELDKNGENVWDYNAQLNLAIEGRLVDDLSAVVQWPQIVLEEDQLIFCYDIQEMDKVGLQVCQKAFHSQLLKAVQTVRREDKKPKLRWRSLPNPPRRGRFPPRVFTRHSCDDLVEDISFECRYHGNIDKNDILSRLEKWHLDNDNMKESRTDGVIDPESATSYRPRWIFRALVKIGINLLAYVMEDKFLPDRFVDAIRFVRNDIGDGPSGNDCGFLEHDVTDTLRCPQNAHKFILQHDRIWALDCSFFGGIVGATVLFPGPNWNKIRRIEIVAPIGSREWEVHKSQVLIARNIRITDRVDIMMPSVAIRNAQMQTRVVRKEPHS